MECHDPHAVYLSDQLFHAASHLSGRLVCECNGKDAPRVDTLFYHVCHTVSHGGCLARTRSREYQNRTIKLPHGFILFTV